MKYILLLGLSKICAGGLIPSILENSKINIIVLSGKTVQHVDVIEHEKCVFSYSCTQFPENTSYDEFIERAESEQTTRVFSLHIESINVIIRPLILNKKLFSCISSAREGILSYLVAFRKSDIDLPVDIICMDNSSTTIEQARHLCKSLELHNISISQGVTHIVCSNMEVKDGHIFVNIDPLLLLTIFPPEVAMLEKYFRVEHQLRSMYQLRFAKSSGEFEYLCRCKLVDVNVIHTVICMIAYCQANSEGITMVDAAKMPIGSILSEDVIPDIMEIHDMLYDKYLAAFAEKIGEQKRNHSLETLLFLKHFITADELIGRGLKAEKSYEREEKLERHLKLLRAIDYQPVNKLIQDYLDLIKE